MMSTVSTWLDQACVHHKHDLRGCMRACVRACGCESHFEREPSVRADHVLSVSVVQQDAARRGAVKGDV